MDMDKNSPAKEKKSISNKWLAGGIILLILIAAVSWYFSRDRGELQEGSVVIKAGDTILGRFTIADLQKLPAVEKKMVISFTCGSDCAGRGGKEQNSSEHNYTGTSLKGVLNSIDPGLTRKYNKVITRGSDYYSQVIEMAEVQEADNVYIVYRDNGQLLKTKTGEEGSLLLLVGDDQSGQYFTNWLVSLELQ